MTSFFILSIIDKHRKKSYAKDLKVFLELLSPRRDDSILDVGAGLGSIAENVTLLSDEVYALEPNDGKVDYMKAKHPQVKAFSATASQIPFPTSYFDKIYIVSAYHHFPDQGDALEEVRRVMKKEGILLIHELDPEGGGRLLSFFGTKILRKKINFLTPEKLENLLSSHGFKLIEKRSAAHGYFILAKNEKQSDESSGRSVRFRNQ